MDTEVKEKTAWSNAAIDTVNMKRDISYLSIRSYALQAFNILDSTLKIFGITLGQSIRMVVSGIFMAIPPLMEIATAQQVSGVMYLQGALAMISLISAIAGAVALEQQQNQAASQFRGSTNLARDLLNLMGRW